jgi:hypothetical protein
MTTDSDILHEDENMKRLLEAIASVPAVVVIAGCGGHEQAGPGRLGPGLFTALVAIEPTEEGWNALALLSLAVSRCPRNGNLNQITIELRYSTDGVGPCNPLNLGFAITGTFPVQPDDLADEILFLVGRPSGAE